MIFFAVQLAFAFVEPLVEDYEPQDGQTEEGNLHQ